MVRLRFKVERFRSVTSEPSRRFCRFEFDGSDAFDPHANFFGQALATMDFQEVVQMTTFRGQSYVCHAEVNAILNTNHASAVGQRLYVTMFPCNECAKIIIQANRENVLLPSLSFSRSRYEAIGVW
ncbi:hypothetical protein NC652_029867 [Populus alba x Populus x berolinensis]|nr:hypothetical protein NC652_029867 [Populus alba x Populus x berolinensis]